MKLTLCVSNLIFTKQFRHSETRLFIKFKVDNVVPVYIFVDLLIMSLSSIQRHLASVASRFSPMMMAGQGEAS